LTVSSRVGTDKPRPDRRADGHSHAGRGGYVDAAESLPNGRGTIHPGRHDAGLVPADHRLPALHPVIETLRGLLLGTEIGNNGWIALAWCVGLIALGYRWSMAQFNRDPK